MTENLFDVLPTNDDTSLRDELTSKWKDKPADEVLKAKIDSDLYIKTLERQKDEMRQMYLQQSEELKAKAKFEELIDRFEKAPKDLQVASPPANEDQPKFNPDEYRKIASETFQEMERSKIESDNFRKVQNKLQDKYGSNYANVLKDQQTTLGLSDTDVNTLAKKSPEAFFRMMGLNEQARESFQTPPRGSQRNDSFAPKGAPKRDWNYYMEMKKSNPKVFLDPKIQVQMHNDAIELGEAFG
jgi:hypothetical protein